MHGTTVKIREITGKMNGWKNIYVCTHVSTSSSVGTATLVGSGLLNYRWVFSAGRFLQSAVASGNSNPRLGGPVIRTFQLPPPGVPHVWNDASEPQQRKMELWARNCREICRKWRKFTTWDRRFYFPSEGRRAEDFFALKIRRLRPDFNPRTSRSPKPLYVCIQGVPGGMCQTSGGCSLC